MAILKEFGRRGGGFYQMQYLYHTESEAETVAPALAEENPATVVPSAHRMGLVRRSQSYLVQLFI